MCLAAQQIAAVRIDHRQRITQRTVTSVELALVVDGPEFIGALRLSQRIRFCGQARSFFGPQLRCLLRASTTLLSSSSAMRRG